MAKKDAAAAEQQAEPIGIDSPEAFINRELSWLGFARRVLALAEDPKLPLLERVKFAGIMGMIHDEFFMKRIGGLKRQVNRGTEKVSLDGRTPLAELMACREQLLEQIGVLARVVSDELRPALAAAGIGFLDYSELSDEQREHLREHFAGSIQPILTPLAVDAEHPFPFISNLGLNIGVQMREEKRGRKRFVRIKVPANRPRFVPLPGDAGCVPIEQVIANNLDQLFPEAAQLESYIFRVTRGAEGDPQPQEMYEPADPEAPDVPGSIIHHVTSELKARRFAGVVCLQVESRMPEKLQNWLAEQLAITSDDIYVYDCLMGLADLMRYPVRGHEELRLKPQEPVTHPRLRDLPHDPEAIFEEIRAGDILLHHPYQSFDSSVLRFLQSAAVDPRVLAIKLTIYRTSSDSPIMRALIEAAKQGKQVAVLVEITARFDEQPNIEWGQLLEKEGAHVAYGVESLKTHVKLALVVREEDDGVRRYVHVGTGNYHAGTARLYEDLGLLTCDPAISADAAAVLNELTGATPYAKYRKLLVAPRYARARFVELIQREIEHAQAGRPCGIQAKMNQLQDPAMIRELYLASQAGVPIALNVRGLCCLRAGVPGLSENIRVFSVVGRYLEHGRIYRFENAGEPEFFIGSADWMQRNLDRRMETITPVTSPEIKSQLETILHVFESDNCSAWDMQPDCSYVRRQAQEGEADRAAQDVFYRLACLP